MSSGRAIPGTTLKRLLKVLYSASPSSFRQREMKHEVVDSGWPGVGTSLAGVGRQWALPGAPQCLACLFGKKAEALNLGPLCTKPSPGNVVLLSPIAGLPLFKQNKQNIANSQTAGFQP